MTEPYWEEIRTKYMAETPEFSDLCDELCSRALLRQPFPYCKAALPGVSPESPLAHTWQVPCPTDRLCTPFPAKALLHALP